MNYHATTHVQVLSAASEHVHFRRIPKRLAPLLHDIPTVGSRSNPSGPFYPLVCPRIPVFYTPRWSQRSIFSGAHGEQQSRRLSTSSLQCAWSVVDGAASQCHRRPRVLCAGQGRAPRFHPDWHLWNSLTRT